MFSSLKPLLIFLPPLVSLFSYELLIDILSFSRVNNRLALLWVGIKPEDQKYRTEVYLAKTMKSSRIIDPDEETWVLQNSFIRERYLNLGNIVVH